MLVLLSTYGGWLISHRSEWYQALVEHIAEQPLKECKTVTDDSECPTKLDPPPSWMSTWPDLPLPAPGPAIIARFCNGFFLYFMHSHCDANRVSTHLRSLLSLFHTTLFYLLYLFDAAGSGTCFIILTTGLAYRWTFHSLILIDSLSLSSTSFLHLLRSS